MAKSKGANPLIYFESHSLIAKSLIDGNKGIRSPFDLLGETAKVIRKAWKPRETNSVESPIKIDLETAEEYSRQINALNSVQL